MIYCCNNKRLLLAFPRMIRSLFSLCLSLTLVLTNATGYHCHGTECASTASAVPLVTAMTDGHDHDHRHSGEDSPSHSPDSGGDESPQSDITDSHSHAFSLVFYKPATLTFMRISATVDKKEDAFIVSDSIKPLLEPPSHG